MSSELNKSQFTIIGLLHCFWWWSMDNAPLGDLSKFTPKEIENGIGWSEFVKSEGLVYKTGRFVAALLRSELIDKGDLSPELCEESFDKPLGIGSKIHDWLDFCGDLMKKRIDRQLEKRKINSGRFVPLKEGKKVPPTVPYRTIPNKDKDICVSFEIFWKSYPRKEAKQPALKAWKKINPDDALLEKMIKGIAVQIKTEQWKKGFIPHASTWLNQKRWEDELVEIKEERVLI